MGCYNVPWVFAVSLATTNTAGKTKKSFTSVTFAVCCKLVQLDLRGLISCHRSLETDRILAMILDAVGNIIGPQFFLGSESPTYPTGIRCVLILESLGRWSICC